eukprot:3401050-Pleurochrysis_carterae.AAC.1
MVATSMATMVAMAATTTVKVATLVLLAAILVASSALRRATNSLHDVLGSVSCRQLLQLMRMGFAAANARYPTASFTDMHSCLWKAGGTFHGGAAPNCDGWFCARICLQLKPPFDMAYPESSAGTMTLVKPRSQLTCDGHYCRHKASARRQHGSA